MLTGIYYLKKYINLRKSQFTLHNLLFSMSAWNMMQKAKAKAMMKVVYHSRNLKNVPTTVYSIVTFVLYNVQRNQYRLEDFYRLYNFKTLSPEFTWFGKKSLHNIQHTRHCWFIVEYCEFKFKNTVFHEFEKNCLGFKKCIICMQLNRPETRMLSHPSNELRSVEQYIYTCDKDAAPPE